MRKRNPGKRLLAVVLSAAMTFSAMAPAAFGEEIVLDGEGCVSVEESYDAGQGDAPEDGIGQGDALEDGAGEDDFVEETGLAADGEEDGLFDETDGVLEEGADPYGQDGDVVADENGSPQFLIGEANGAGSDTLEGISNEDLFDFVGEDGEPGEADTAYEAADDLAQKGTPPKVTGVNIWLKGDDYPADTLYWDAVDGVSEVGSYEFQVSDANGRPYGWGDGTERYSDHSYMIGSKTPQYFLAELSSDVMYNAEGQIVRDETGKALKALAPGGTYTIKVRAVFKETSYDTGEEVVSYHKGEWSDGVSYTAPAAKDPVRLTGLALDCLTEDEDGDVEVCFNYNENPEDGFIVYEFTDKADFTEGAVHAGTWSATADEKLLFYIYPHYQYAPGTIIHVRAYHRSSDGHFITETGKVADRDYNDDGTYNKPAWTTCSFALPGETAIPTVTGFRLIDQERGVFTFGFDEVRTSKEDGYFLQYSKDPSFPEGDGTKKISAENVMRVNLNDDDFLEDGRPVYVRVVLYRRKYNAETENYEYTYGACDPANIAVTKQAVTPLTTITLKNRDAVKYVIESDGILGSDSANEWWISTDPAFVNKREGEDTATHVSLDDRTYDVWYNSLTPGKVYYVRARTKARTKYVITTGGETEYVSDSYDNAEGYDTFYPFSNTVTLKVALPDADLYPFAVGNTSISIRMSASGAYTGYELQRKTGSKWVRLIRSTDNVYKDAGLTADTAYQYRARTYYYDTDTQAYAYGKWTTVDAMTAWGGNLNLQAVATGTTKVKLTWNKMKGAGGFEVYQYVGVSKADQIKNGVSNGYGKWELIKTLKKNKRSFTVTKLTAGTTQSFKVRAFRKVGNKTYYIEDCDVVDLGFHKDKSLSVKKNVLNADGSITITWQQVMGASGYLVEKENEAGEWETFKKLAGAKKKSVRLPADPSLDVRYRIAAYRNVDGVMELGAYARFDDEDTITVYAAIPTPKNVKAVAAADGSITISWSPSAGADYYEVYYSTDKAAVLNANVAGYENVENVRLVPLYVQSASNRSGYRESNDPLTATSVVHRKVTYTADGIEYVEDDGPEAGVKYYYYVRAYKYRNGTSKDTGSKDLVSSAYSKPASATVSSVSVKKTKVTKVQAAKKKVTISWKKVADAKGYEIYRSTRKKAGYMKVGDITNGKTTKFVDKTAVKGVKYYYKVKAVKYNEAGAYKTSGLSAASKQVVAK